jgi:hypothetical protein
MTQGKNNGNDSNSNSKDITVSKLGYFHHSPLQD